jgi:hypothetical protein
MPNLPSGAGQQDKDHSLSVVLASDQAALPVTISGADVQVDIDSSNLATHTDALAGNASLTSIDGKLGSDGAVAAADGAASATTMGATRSRGMAFNGTTWDRIRAGVTAIGNAVTGFGNQIPWAFFNTTPTTRTTGQGGPIEADALGNLRIAEQAPPAAENQADASINTHEKPATSAAYNAIPYDIIAKGNQGIVKAAPGNLYRIYFTNTNAALKVVALVNKATAPSADVPTAYYYVPANSTILIEFKFGKRFSNGIAWAQVTTIGAGTITLDGTSDVLVSAECS